MADCSLHFSTIGVAWAIGRRSLIFTAAISCCFTLNACQSSGPFYHVRTQQPTKEVALHTGGTRPTNMVMSERMKGRQPDVTSSVNGSILVQGEDGVGQISPKDRALTDEVPGQHGKRLSREFGSSPIVGSAQWYREHAEDEVRELELRRKLRICAC
jgi:hypothetical protein